MFVITQGFPTNSFLLFVPSSNTLVQVISGAGLPVALQDKYRTEPSVTVLLSLGEVIPGGTERKETWLTINGFGVVSSLQGQTSS